MIGVDCVSQTKAVGEKRRAELHRIGSEGDEGPNPDCDIDADQQHINADDLAAHIGGAVVEDTRQRIVHRTSPRFFIMRGSLAAKSMRGLGRGSSPEPPTIETRRSVGGAIYDVYG